MLLAIQYYWIQPDELHIQFRDMERGRTISDTYCNDDSHCSTFGRMRHVLFLVQCYYHNIVSDWLARSLHIR